MKNSINTKRFVEKLQESAFTYTLISIIIGFIVGAIALLIAGYNPIESYGKLFGVIFRSTKNISYSFIEYSVPYILTGLSVAFAFKTGVFNIGAEGQYVMGSVAAMLVGAFVNRRACRGRALGRTGRLFENPFRRARSAVHDNVQLDSLLFFKLYRKS